MLPGLLASSTQNFTWCRLGGWPSFGGLDVTSYHCHWSIYVGAPEGLFCSSHFILVYCFCLLEVKGILYNYIIQVCGISCIISLRSRLQHVSIYEIQGNSILFCTMLTSVLRDTPHHFLHLSPLA